MILTDGFVQDDSRPVPRRKLGLADVGDRARFRAADPYSVADLETVRILGQNDAGICAQSNRTLFEIRPSTYEHQSLDRFAGDKHNSPPLPPPPCQGEKLETNITGGCSHVTRNLDYE